MSQNITADDADDELADKHDDVGVGRQQFSGTFEYEVVMPTDKVDDVPYTAAEFAQNIAKSRFRKETGASSLMGVDTMASEEDSWDMNAKRRFTVWVRHD